ncbi:hypothetical protein CDAR_422981 [Caerostris darwini]|uniref:Uncharacterized protein n=1 Tax=Caerostris darwini TaxID=1538125 RepID=A0AAV4TJ15_9ARAC|nr:hypothetical protein CDAR_422981 [Caerostris darwini]
MAVPMTTSSSKTMPTEKLFLQIQGSSSLEIQAQQLYFILVLYFASISNKELTIESSPFPILLKRAVHMATLLSPYQQKSSFFRSKLSSSLEIQTQQLYLILVHYFASICSKG